MSDQVKAQPPNVAPKGNTSRIVLSTLTLIFLLVFITFYLLLGSSMIGQLETTSQAKPDALGIFFVVIMSAPLMGVSLVMVGIGVVIAWSVKEKAPRLLSIAGVLLSLLSMCALFLGFALTYTSLGFTMQSASIVLGSASLVLLTGALCMILMRSLGHPSIARWVRLLAWAVVVAVLLVAIWFVYKSLS